MNNDSLEMQFLKDDQCRISAFLGVKGGGKSHLMLQLMQFYLITQKYKFYHLILPAYKTDNDQTQYEFLKHIDPKTASVKLYNKYSELLIEHILKNTDKKKGKSIVVLDDSTSSGKDISNSDSFIHLVTTSRHLDISIIIISHALRGIFKPVIRTNIDYFFFFRIINAKLLEMIYEEYLSLNPQFENFKAFKNYYIDNVLNIDHQGLFLNTLNNKYDSDIKNWEVNNKDFSKYFIGIDKKVKEIMVDAERDKFLMQMQEKEMKENFKNKLIKKK